MMSESILRQRAQRVDFDDRGAEGVHKGLGPSAISKRHETY